MVDFSNFDNNIDSKELKTQMEKANENEYEEVKKGEYTVKVQNLEVKPTKKGDKLMLSASFKITGNADGSKKHVGQWLFFNRVIAGNRNTGTWNDGAAISGVLTWLKELMLSFGFEQEDCDIEFTTYSDFAEDVLDIYQDLGDDEIDIEYDPDAFNPIKIL
jgi:hypothetical protein